MEVSKKEVLRYLGCRAEPDGRVLDLIDQLIAELLVCAEPKRIYGIWECRVNAPTIEINGMIANSANLAGHLKDCGRVVLFAATLGAGIDALICRYGVLDMEKAVIAEAVCAAMIEAYCDQIQREIMCEKEAAGLFLTSRFSPGYGDFNIAHQKDILRLLDCGRRIGLTLTDGYMLTPSKSVTAVIGLRREREKSGGKCARCGFKQCGFREVK